MKSIYIFCLIENLFFVHYILLWAFKFLFLFDKFCGWFFLLILFYFFLLKIWILFESYFCQCLILKKLLCLIFEVWLSSICILRWFWWGCSFLWFLLYICRFVLLKKIILFNNIFVLKLRWILKILLLRISSSLLMNIFPCSWIRSMSFCEYYFNELIQSSFFLQSWSLTILKFVFLGFFYQISLFSKVDYFELALSC